MSDNNDVTRKSAGFVDYIAEPARILLPAFGAAAAILTVGLYAVPFSHEQSVSFRSVNSETRVVTDEFGTTFKMAAADLGKVEAGVDYRCDVSEPMAAEMFPLAATVPTFLRGVSGCKPA